MIALLDTHSFLWAAIEPARLTEKVRKVIVDPNNEICLSTISLWEISLKFALGKLDLTGCAPDDLVAVARNMGLTLVSPTPEESAGFHRLPKQAHKDPFDRMLIWQCLQRDWVLLTCDEAMDAYREQGLRTLWK